MKNAAIVCEYNPFHLGHKYQIDKLKEEGAECIICVMSGNFTQRGEAAIADKYTRAYSALLCGAEIVLELPFPYSSLSAEGFARAGAYIADATLADTLCFGSECGDIDKLQEAARTFSCCEFREAFSSVQKTSNSSARAYFEAYKKVSGRSEEFSSNDLLGISYIRAINDLGLDISPRAIKRVGSSYTDKEISSMPSAMAIRELLYRGDIDSCRATMPTEAFEVLSRAVKNGETASYRDKFFEHIHSFFRLCTPDEISARALSLCGGERILDEGEGILQRICACAKRCTSSEEFYFSLFNSRYTNTRIQRVILYSLLGVSDLYRNKLPSYTLLLGASKTGCEYLSKIRKTQKINIVTKPSDIPENVDGILSRRADALFTLLTGQVKESGYFLKKSPVILI